MPGVLAGARLEGSLVGAAVCVTLVFDTHLGSVGCHRRMERVGQAERPSPGGSRNRETGGWGL